MTTHAPAAAAMFNPIQEKILKDYQYGEFAHLCEPDATEEDLEHCGDGLLVFVINELANSEGCDTVDTAYDRIQRGIKDLSEILDIIDTVEEDACEACQ